jgi:hypothetical protein
MSALHELEAAAALCELSTTMVGGRIEMQQSG